MNLAAQVDFALKQVGPPVKQVYKRTTTTSGGSTLLGIQTASPTITDTLLNPQPMPTQLGERAAELSSSGLVLESSDYEVILSANSITIAELEASTLTFVLKAADGTGTVEEYRMLGYNPYQFQGSYVAYSVYLRRKTTN